MALVSVKSLDESNHLLAWGDGANVDWRQGEMQNLRLDKRIEVDDWHDSRFSARNGRAVTCTASFEKGTKFFVFPQGRVLVVESEVDVYEVNGVEEAAEVAEEEVIEEEQDCADSAGDEIKADEPDEAWEPPAKKRKRKLDSSEKRADKKPILNDDKPISANGSFITPGSSHILQNSPSEDLIYSYADKLELKEPVLPLAEMLTCLLCRKVFPNEKDLDKHRSVHTINTDSNRCCVEKCEKVLSNKEVYEHMRSHHKTLICERCFQFKLPGARHKCVESGCLCLKCGKRFARAALLSAHSMHPPNCFRLTAGRVCYWCDTEFETHGELAKHEAERVAKGRWACCSCDKRISLTSVFKLRKHASLEHGKWRETCEKCGMVFLDRMAFHTHTRDHDALVCGTCGRTFRTKSFKTQHYQTAANKTCRDEFLASGGSIREYPCLHCGKTFYNSVFLRLHVSSHKSELGEKKTHQCETCNKSFTKPVELRDHIHMHLGIRPFACAGCGKHFRIRHYMANTLYHKCPKTLPDPDSSYPCIICNTSFRTKKELLKHELSRFDVKGGEFSCCRCGVRFENGLELTQHLESYFE